MNQICNYIHDKWDNMDKLVDEIITCDYNELKENLNKIKFNKKMGFVVILNEVKYEFLLNIKYKGNDLICLGPSGLRTQDEINEFKGRPMFSRHSWNFEESVLLYSDNTRYVWDENLGAGWGLGLPDDFFLENLGNIIVKIAEYFNIKNKNILFYGSSMGGFTSIQLATMIKESHAIAENPQIDASKWMEQVYVKNGLTSELYEKNNINKFKPYTYNTLELMKKENYIPNLTIITDRFHLDIQEQLSLIFNELNKLPFKSDDYNKLKIIIEPSLKHEPIPPDKFYEILKIYRSIKRKDYYSKKINYNELSRGISIIKKLKLFDEKFYVNKYHIDMMDPLTHYILTGWKEGLNPSKKFDTYFYLETHKDVKNSGMNPLVHYALYGMNENRITHPK